MLQGPDTENAALQSLSQFLKENNDNRRRRESSRPTTPKSSSASASTAADVTVTLTNYTKNGRPFRNYLRIVPLVDSESANGQVHFLGVLEEVESESASLARANA